MTKTIISPPFRPLVGRRGESNREGYRPRRCTERELRKVQVEVLAGGMFTSLRLSCGNCGCVWEPSTLGGRWGETLQRGYWICPAGCNAPR